MLIRLINISILFTTNNIKMYNPEIRYLFQEEEVEVNEIMPLIYPEFIEEIYKYTSNILVGFATMVGMIALYKQLSYTGIGTQYICSYIWSMLSPGNEWLDLLLIITSIAAGIMIFIALNGITDILDKGFIKLKDEIKKKDQRIKELEEKLKNNMK